MAKTEKKHLASHLSRMEILVLQGGSWIIQVDIFFYCGCSMNHCVIYPINQVMTTCTSVFHVQSQTWSVPEDWPVHFAKLVLNWERWCWYFSIWFSQSSFEKELDAALVRYLSIVLDLTFLSSVIFGRSHLRGNKSMYFDGELALLNKILIVRWHKIS